MKSREMLRRSLSTCVLPRATRRVSRHAMAFFPRMSDSTLRISFSLMGMNSSSMSSSLMMNMREYVTPPRNRGWMEVEGVAAHLSPVVLQTMFQSALACRDLDTLSLLTSQLCQHPDWQVETYQLELALDEFIDQKRPDLVERVLKILVHRDPITQSRLAAINWPADDNLSAHPKLLTGHKGKIVTPQLLDPPLKIIQRIFDYSSRFYSTNAMELSLHALLAHQADPNSPSTWTLDYATAESVQRMLTHSSTTPLGLVRILHAAMLTNVAEIFDQFDHRRFMNIASVISPEIRTELVSALPRVYHYALQEYEKGRALPIPFVQTLSALSVVAQDMSALQTFTDSLIVLASSEERLIPTTYLRDREPFAFLVAISRALMGASGVLTTPDIRIRDILTADQLSLCQSLMNFLIEEGRSAAVGEYGPYKLTSFYSTFTQLGLALAEDKSVITQKVVEAAYGLSVTDGLGEEELQTATMLRRLLEFKYSGEQMVTFQMLPGNHRRRLHHLCEHLHLLHRVTAIKEVNGRECHAIQVTLPERHTDRLHSATKEVFLVGQERDTLITDSVSSWAERSSHRLRHRTIGPLHRITVTQANVDSWNNVSHRYPNVDSPVPLLKNAPSPSSLTSLFHDWVPQHWDDTVSNWLGEISERDARMAIQAMIDSIDTSDAIRWMLLLMDSHAHTSIGRPALLRAILRVCCKANDPYAFIEVADNITAAYKRNGGDVEELWKELLPYFHNSFSHSVIPNLRDAERGLLVVASRSIDQSEDGQLLRHMIAIVGAVRSQPDLFQLRRRLFGKMSQLVCSETIPATYSECAIYSRYLSSAYPSRVLYNFPLDQRAYLDMSKIDLTDLCQVLRKQASKLVEDGIIRKANILRVVQFLDKSDVTSRKALFTFMKAFLVDFSDAVNKHHDSDRREELQPFIASLVDACVVTSYIICTEQGAPKAAFSLLASLGRSLGKWDGRFHPPTSN